jgi:hypothetical protein
MTLTAFPFPRVRPLMLRVIIGSLITAAAVSIFSIAVSDFNDTSGKLVGTAFLFFFLALFSWYDAEVSARRSERFALLSFVVSLYLFVAGLAKLWVANASEGYGYDFLGGFVGFLALAFVARAALLHAHLVLNTAERFPSAVINAVTKVTLALVLILTVQLSIPVLFSPADLGDLYWRIVGVAAILDVLGTVLIPLGYALFRQTTAPVTLGAITSADITPMRAPGFRPAGAAYAKPGAPIALQWPSYADGTPLPAAADGNPNFTGVLGYEDWVTAQ